MGSDAGIWGRSTGVRWVDPVADHRKLLDARDEAFRMVKMIPACAEVTRPSGPWWDVG